jgi:CheY-like chemotaxis protein
VRLNVALRILLADDSMTAQNMGKKILADAGYEVTAVSNGAAAAKKIAEKFDIVILDVYMPGYTGLEVCEKLRAGVDTAKTPVLLTVGKMETGTFKPEDANKVKADGVIIKPFEATDLLATVQKFEEKLKAASAPKAPSYEETIVMAPHQVQEFKDDSYAQWKSEAAEEMEPPAPAAIEVPQEMQSAPAFGMEYMEASAAAEMPAPIVSVEPEPASAPSFSVSASGAAAAMAPEPAASIEASAAPRFDAAPAGFDLSPTLSPDNTMSIGAPDPIMPDPVMPEPVLSASELPSYEKTVKIPAYQDAPPVAEEPTLSEVETKSISALLEPTSAAPVTGHIEIGAESGLELTSAAPHEVAVQAESGRVTNSPEMMEFATKFGIAEAQSSEQPSMVEPMAEEAPAAAAPAADDFEAKLAAAMSSYEVAEEPEVEAEPEAAAPELAVEDTQQFKAAVEEAVGAPAEEHHEIEISSAHHATEEIDVPRDPMLEVGGGYSGAVAVPAAEPEPEPEAELPNDSHLPPSGMQDAALVEQMQAAVADMPVAEPHLDEEVAHPPDTEMVKQLAAAVGAGATGATTSPGLDPEHVASVVSKILERVLPSIMAEVAKELKK